MAVDCTHPEGKQAAKRWMLFWTAIYFLLFFPLLGGILCLSLIVSEELSLWLAIPFIGMFVVVVVLSLPASICLMWSNYLRGRYKRVHFFWIFPFIIIAIECVIEGFLRALFL
jgi:hypothetical protein